MLNDPEYAKRWERKLEWHGRPGGTSCRSTIRGMAAKAGRSLLRIPVAGGIDSISHVPSRSCSVGGPADRFGDRMDDR